MFRSIGSYGQTLIDAIGQTFSPPPNATARQIRINGALCIVAAILIVATMAAAAFAWAEFNPGASVLSPRVILAPVLLFYVLAMFGGFRLLIGKSPAAHHPAEVSGKRIAYGVASIILVFATIIGLVFIAAYFLEPQ